MKGLFYDQINSQPSCFSARAALKTIVAWRNRVVSVLQKSHTVMLKLQKKHSDASFKRFCVKPIHHLYLYCIYVNSSCFTGQKSHSCWMSGCDACNQKFSFRVQRSEHVTCMLGCICVGQCWSAVLILALFCYFIFVLIRPLTSKLQHCWKALKGHHTNVCVSLTSCMKQSTGWVVSTGAFCVIVQETHFVRTQDGLATCSPLKRFSQ